MGTPGTMMLASSRSEPHHAHFITGNRIPLLLVSYSLPSRSPYSIEPVPTALEAFSDFLEIDHHPDGWADDAVLPANTLATKLSLFVWATLFDTWHLHKPGRQERLADAIDESPAEHAVPLLRRMSIGD